VANKKTNIERLAEAKILNPDHFSDHDRIAIESISAEEVAVLIKLREKLGEAPPGNERMRPNFPV
jgi:hypothetical protein